MLNKDRAQPQQILTWIIVAAVLIRIVVAFLMGDKVTVLPGIQDQVSYDALARSILDGRGYSFTKSWYPFTPANTPTAHWSFIYPLYLAGVYAVTGYHPLAARLIQAVLFGALICFLIYKIGRRVANEETGLVAAGLSAVYGYFIYYSAALMTEPFFIVAILLALHLSLEIKEQPTLRRWIALGITLGVAALLRQTILFFVPFLLLWLFWESNKANIRLWHFAIPVIVMTLFIAPWTVRNYRVYHQLLPINSNAGYALYASTHPHLGTQWSNENIVVPIPEDLLGQNEAQLNDALTQKGVEFILADPQRYFWLTLSKTLEYFKFWPTRDSGWISNANRVLSFGLYFPFMLVGLYLSFSRWRSYLPLYLFSLVHTGIHLLSWPAPRYRLSVDAVCMVFAGLAVLHLHKQFSSWRRGISRIAKPESSSGEGIKL